MMVLFCGIDSATIALLTNLSETWSEIQAARTCVRGKCEREKDLDCDKHIKKFD